jgi:hypothetical protein
VKSVVRAHCYRGHCAVGEGKTGLEIAFIKCSMQRERTATFRMKWTVKEDAVLVHDATLRKRAVMNRNGMIKPCP